MGADYREMTVKAGTAKELTGRWWAIREDIAWREGNGGYTGTFAEKDDIYVVRDVGQPTTLEEARAHCEEHNDKWGPADAYYLGNDLWYVGGHCSS